MSEQFDLKKLMQDAGGYSPEALRFLRDGLAHTVKMIHGVEDTATDPADESRHVSGQQLCLGLRDYAIERYGPLARTVLARWGVTKTDDFGNIVFAMVEAGWMRKTDDDTIDDFRGVYEFDEAFDGAFQLTLNGAE